MSTKEAIAEHDDSIRARSKILSDSMVSPSAVRDLSERSDFHGLAHLVAHLALIYGAWFMATTCTASDASSSSASSLVFWFWFLLQAFFMSFLFMPEHECSHGTAFKSSMLNTIVGHGLGLAIFRPYRHYRFYHFNHHKFTGDKDRDPELQDSFIDLRLDSWQSYLLYLTGIPFWIDRSTTLVRHGFLGWILPREEGFLTERTRPQLLEEAKLYVAFYMFLGISAVYNDKIRYALLWYWLLPTFAAQPFLRFYLIAEHVGCPVGENMLSNTRTTDTFWWYRWLAWNMPFHAEHHAFPGVPFYQLPELHRKLSKFHADRQCNPTGEKGYLGVHRGLIAKFVKG